MEYKTPALAEHFMHSANDGILGVNREGESLLIPRKRFTGVMATQSHCLGHRNTIYYSARRKGKYALLKRNFNFIMGPIYKFKFKQISRRAKQDWRAFKALQL